MYLWTCTVSALDFAQARTKIPPPTASTQFPQAEQEAGCWLNDCICPSEAPPAGQMHRLHVCCTQVVEQNMLYVQQTRIWPGTTEVGCASKTSGPGSRGGRRGI